MSIKQYDVWIADLHPRMGTESGKTRPVVIVQTDLLNAVPHPSTIICPVTTNVLEDVGIMRVHLKKGEGGINQPSDVLIDQARAIDNRRLVRKTGRIDPDSVAKLKENLKIVLDL
jgi:mRNA interferase MazF